MSNDFLPFFKIFSKRYKKMSVQEQIIFLMEALDNKIKKPEDIEECIGIPVLGTVYEYETNNKNNKKKSKKKIA